MRRDITNGPLKIGDTVKNIRYRRYYYYLEIACDPMYFLVKDCRTGEKLRLYKGDFISVASKEARQWVNGHNL